MPTIPAAAIKAAATELATLANLPRMAAQALLDAGAVNVGGRLLAQIDEQDARVEEVAVAVLRAALPHLLPTDRTDRTDRTDDIGTDGGGTWPDPRVTDMAQRYGRLVVPPGDDWEVRPDGDPGDRPRRPRPDRTDDTPDD